jgi:hypothetical protein
VRPITPIDSPIVHFFQLLVVHDRGEFEGAITSQRELERHGWVVKYRRPRTQAPVEKGRMTA